MFVTINVSLYDIVLSNQDLIAKGPVAETCELIDTCGLQNLHTFTYYRYYRACALNTEAGMTQ